MDSYWTSSDPVSIAEWTDGAGFTGIYGAAQRSIAQSLGSLTSQDSCRPLGLYIHV